MRRTFIFLAAVKAAIAITNADERKNETAGQLRYNIYNQRERVLLKYKFPNGQNFHEFSVEGNKTCGRKTETVIIDETIETFCFINVNFYTTPAHLPHKNSTFRCQKNHGNF